MKKLISMILALAMIFAMSIPAVASELPQDTVINVEAQYTGEAAGEIATVYYVKVEWTAGENTLTYTNNATSYSWDAENMKYVVANAEAVAGNGWSGSALYTIKATNQSNAAVNAAISVAGVEGITAEGDFGEADNVLNMGNAAENVTYEEGSAGSAKSDSVDVTVTVSDGAITAAGNVATITITLSAAE